MLKIINQGATISLFDTSLLMRSKFKLYMKTKKRQKIRLIGVCLALGLSLASYLTLHILEAPPAHLLQQEMMAEEVESGDALPDVQLLKKLMSKTLEFMLRTPKL